MHIEDFSDCQIESQRTKSHLMRARFCIYPNIKKIHITIRYLTKCLDLGATLSGWTITQDPFHASILPVHGLPF